MDTLSRIKQCEREQAERNKERDYQEWLTSLSKDKREKVLSNLNHQRPQKDKRSAEVNDSGS